MAMALMADNSFYLSVPVDTNHTQLAIATINRLRQANKRVWYIAPRKIWSSFRIFALRSHLGFDKCALAVDQLQQNEALPITLWSTETLHTSSWQLGTSVCPWPDMVIIPSFERLGDPDCGRAIETVVMQLAQQVPTLFISYHLTNQTDVTKWLESLWHPSTMEAETVSVKQTHYPLTFLTPEWDITPLLDKKRVAPRVKNITREFRPLRQVSGDRFVQRLLATLRHHHLFPATVVLPTPADCMEAARAGSIRTSDASSVLTLPEIRAFLDQHPSLKSRPELTAYLKRRTAPYLPDTDPLMAELAERLSMLKLGDVLFTTLPNLAQQVNPVCAVVFCSTRTMTHSGQRPINAHEFSAAYRLLDSDDGRECFILTNAVDVDAVPVKDLALEANYPLNSQMDCDALTTLRSLTLAAHDPHGFLQRSFRTFSLPERSLDPMHTFETELAEHIPSRACASPRAAFHLIEATRNMQVQLDQLELAIEKDKATAHEVATHQQLESQLSHLPCQRCFHQPQCQQRGARKIRYLADDYYDEWRQLKKSRGFLTWQLDTWRPILTELEFIAETGTLTERGHLALASGLAQPFMLVACHDAGLVDLQNDTATRTLMAAFVENESLLMPQSEADDTLLQDIWPKVTTQCQQTQEILFKHGVVLAMPSLATMQIVKAKMDGLSIDKIASLFGTTYGHVARIIARTEALHQRVRDFFRSAYSPGDKAD